MSTPLPTGTVTFLFTDLEGSTRQWEEHRDSMAVAVARHHSLLEEAINGHGGVVFSYGGDGVAAAFTTAPAAVAGAVAAQVALEAEPWGDAGPLRARMGVHTGEGRVIGSQYESHTLNRCARLMAVAHGGQLVISGSTAELVVDHLPAGATLVDLGEHRLRDLQSLVHVFQVEAAGLATQFPPLRSLNALPGNLPRQMTSFVGREAEVGALQELVRQTSMVTLTGVGGVGKTRLALQVAADVVATFPDGAWMCELAPITDPALVWDALAATLGVKSSLGRPAEEAVLEYLAAKRMLLVLDNCEHLLDAVARMVDSIAHRCEEISVLATSREGLALSGERIVAVPALSLPSKTSGVELIAATDAVKLFADRAAAARSDFEVTERNAAAVATLCRRLDGIPLALELAAARVRSMSPDDLVARLDQRFKLLTRGSRAALERHQTLRNTIDWSYDLLEPGERTALNQLSVFVGSCDLLAAEAILAGDEVDVSDVADLLGQLVDKSLVVADRAEGDGGVRFRLLETIRQYAAERLQASGETAAVRRRHADHFVAEAERAGPHLRSWDQIEWANLMLRDLENFRAVLDWAIEAPSADHALRLVAPFAVTGAAIGEASQEWAQVAIDVPEAELHPLFSFVAAWAALGAVLATDYELAEVLIRRAETTQAPTAPEPAVLRARGVLALYRGDHPEAQVHAKAWADLARASGEPHEIAHALLLLAGTLTNDSEARVATLEELIQVSRDAGIASALSIALPFLANNLPTEESARALPLLEEAVEVAERLGDRRGAALALGSKGAWATREGAWSTGLEAACESAELMRDLGGLVTIKDSFHLGGISLSALGNHHAAAVVIAKADALSPRGGPGLSTDWWWSSEVERADAAILEALGEDQVANLTARGAAMTVSEAVDYMRTQATELDPRLVARTSTP